MSKTASVATVHHRNPLPSLSAWRRFCLLPSRTRLQTLLSRRNVSRRRSTSPRTPAPRSRRGWLATARRCRISSARLSCSTVRPSGSWRRESRMKRSSRASVPQGSSSARRCRGSSFAAQDELSAGARQLAAAAVAGGDDKVLAERFAVVTHSCVTCHSAYLHGRPDLGALGAQRRRTVRRGSRAGRRRRSSGISPSRA